MTTRVFFAFFLVSGFCSLVYEVVWLRLAMAQFGVTTGLVSIVLSVFMGGLALGSWGAGRLTARFEDRPPALLVRSYAAAEIVVALSRDAVPNLLARGRGALDATNSDAWGSAGYYLASSLWIAVALVPFCVCMGATFPLAMGAIRRMSPGPSTRSFSYLYAANVVGATMGTLVSAFVLIETLGFRGTLSVAAALNALLAAGALILSLALAAPGAAPVEALESIRTNEPRDGLVGAGMLWALFCTGFVSMAMEVVWVRLLTPYLGNVVYAFASILALYLVATSASSFLYRWRARRGDALTVTPALWGAMALAGLLLLVAADPRWALRDSFLSGMVRAAIGIMPFCGLLGYATPLLVDRWSGGNPERAGTAYAVNVLGCIAGPVLAGFVLLPRVGESMSLLLLALPLFMLGAMAGGIPGGDLGRESLRAAIPLGAAAIGAVVILTATRTYESRFAGAQVRRDSTATVTASGQGMGKRLLVNGIGMTYLTPITKMMVHLPLAMMAARPRNALIVCFGMGTTFRSALSWDVDTTVVELVPSVPDFFGFFHADGPALLRSPKAHVVIDDGRRFLERSRTSYDVIVIDPPPPLAAAGSSLLYSREFCETVKKRLSPGGIFQQWIPGGDPVVIPSMVRALQEAFPHVVGFTSTEGWGAHSLASREPLPQTPSAVLAGRMPAAAARDLLEWGPATTPEAQFESVLEKELALDQLIPSSTRGLVDDRPANEYYLIRSLRRSFNH